MNNMLLQLVVAMTIVIGLSLVPSLAAAQLSGQQNECNELKALIESGGGGRADQLPAYCDTGTIYTKLTYWMYYIVGIAAVISLIYSGYMYMTARDNESQLKKAKTILIWTIAGVALALLATIIVGAVINLVVDNKLL